MSEMYKLSDKELAQAVADFVVKKHKLPWVSISVIICADRKPGLRSFFTNAYKFSAIAEVVK